MNYETRKNLWLIAIALLFAALAATLATRWMKSRVAAADAGNKNFAAIVVTARDVPMGKRLVSRESGRIFANCCSIRR